MSLSNKKFMDSTGLSTLWTKIKTTFITQDDLITAVGLIDSAKQDTIDDLNTIRTNASSGAKHAGTSHAPSNAQQNVQSDWNATSGDALILNKPTIPSAVTETTVSGWGFTKNVGTLTASSSLDATKLVGTVPQSALPSYVDDVIEGYFYNNNFYEESGHTTQITGETGKIYVDLSTNKTYRWSGSAFVVISETLAIGTTASTAAAGNHTHDGYAASNHTHSELTAIADSVINALS